MTDFLTQLVARSSGSAETIRPRLTSIFEPTQPAMGSVAQSANTPEIFDNLPVFEETPFEGRLSAERLGSPITESLTGREHRLHETGPEAAVLAARLGPPPLPLVSPVADSPSGQPEHRLHETGPDATVLAARLGPPPLRPRGTQPAPMTGFAPLPESATSESSPKGHVIKYYPATQATQMGALSPATPTPVTGPDGEIQGVSPGASGLAVHPNNERVAARERGGALGLRPLDEAYLVPKPLPTNSTVPPPASFARESKSTRVRTISKVDLTRQDAAEVRLAAESEPVIHVTIGRIEVRATSTPAPATPKVRSTPAVMSLDQYLRQRSQRGRE